MNNSHAKKTTFAQHQVSVKNMIENLIQSLFRDNKRIIIPKFGAFLPEKAAEPNTVRFMFSPYLKFNDGFLRRALSSAYNLEAAEADEAISKFVTHIENELSIHKMALVPNFGAFFYDIKKDLHFLYGKDVVLLKAQITTILKQEREGELMDRRLDEFTLSLIEGESVEQTHDLQDVTQEQNSTSFESEQMSAPSDGDFFQLSDADSNTVEKPEQLRKAKDIETLQQQLTNLEKAKEEHLQKIRTSTPRYNDGIELDQKQTSQSTWTHRPTNKTHYANNFPSSRFPSYNEPEVEESDATFSHQHTRRTHKRSKLPTILITLLLLIIFGTSGFLYFRNEVTDFIDTYIYSTENEDPIPMDFSSTQPVNKNTYHVVIEIFTSKNAADRYARLFAEKNPKTQVEVITTNKNRYGVSIFKSSNETEVDARVKILRKRFTKTSKVIQ